MCVGRNVTGPPALASARTRTSPLGAGGMAEVYRARDTKLDRLVAIKILPDTFAARFEREAETPASLRHPNIAVVHGFEKTNRARALVTALVEGETRADRIGREPIPV
jgi:eukaryotic-like serine/threonine-protein kinase